MMSAKQWFAVIAAVGFLPMHGLAQAQSATLECQVVLGDGVSSAGFVWLNDNSTNFWNLGAVPRGGSRDTRYNSGDPTVIGPGAFKVQNVGLPCKLMIDTSFVSLSPTETTCAPTDRLPPGEDKYALAVASNAGEPVPLWRMLYPAGFNNCTAVLTPYVGTGETIIFDLKYWAPSSGMKAGGFRVSVSAGPINE